MNNQPTTWIVTRHPGAQAFIARQGMVGEVMPHLDLTRVCPGDRIIGNLPVNTVARLNQLGIQYWHLCIELTQELRGQELTADTLEQLGASIRPFQIIEGC